MPDFDQAFLYAMQYQDMSATFAQSRIVFAPRLNFVTNPARFLHISLSIFV